MQVLLFDMINALSTAMDLISPAVVHHHKRTAFIAGAIAREMRLPGPEVDDIILAAMLHDGGALSLRDKLDALQFEADGLRHAELGRRLLARLDDTGVLARIVRHHHTPFVDRNRYDPAPPRGAHIIHVADRIEVLLHRDRPLAELLPDIEKRLWPRMGSTFSPEAVMAWTAAAARPEIRAGLIETSFKSGLLELSDQLRVRTLDMDGLERFAGVFAQVIDFRSRFTSTHSSGVASTGMHLAGLMGFAPDNVRKIGVAGHVHDLGKLAVPVELIDKPGRLSPEEFATIRNHAKAGYEILVAVPGLSDLAIWAGLHHERPNGQGYPFGLTSDDLDLGTMIVAASDVFTAIAEDRPYRKGMAVADCARIMSELDRDGALDHDVVGVLLGCLNDVDEVRRLAQTESLRNYGDFYHP